MSRIGSIFACGVCGVQLGLGDYCTQTIGDETRTLHEKCVACVACGRPAFAESPAPRDRRISGVVIHVVCSQCVVCAQQRIGDKDQFIVAGGLYHIDHAPCKIPSHRGKCVVPVFFDSTLTVGQCVAWSRVGYASLPRDAPADAASTTSSSGSARNA